MTVGDLLAAPVGVALLDRIEARHRHHSFRPFEAFPDSDPTAVRAGAQQVTEMSIGELLSLALDAAGEIAGPWIGHAPGSLALAYIFAPARRAIAEALWERISADLLMPMDPASQQCWLSDIEGAEPASAFRDFSRVYGNGEFTWDGFWTVTDPPVETHDELISSWEMYPGPITRWRLPVRPPVRIWTIDHPSDWVRLVESYPKVASHGHRGWELPGVSQELADVQDLCAVAGQHAARTTASQHVLPDWGAVARDYDGVHLSWAGFLTSEGYVSDLDGGGVTMLRYWGSERTLWLGDVFGDPEPLAGPELSGSVCGAIGLDADGGDDVRTTADISWMATTLGRSPPD